MPDLLTLAAMKAFAMGRRAKWKDYVDFYFILKNIFAIDSITTKAQELFGNQFVKKQFHAQVGYFKDINFEEQVNYLIDSPPSDQEIKDYLTKASISDL